MKVGVILAGIGSSPIRFDFFEIHPSTFNICMRIFIGENGVSWQTADSGTSFPQPPVFNLPIIQIQGTESNNYLRIKSDIERWRVTNIFDLFHDLVIVALRTGNTTGSINEISADSHGLSEAISWFCIMPTSRFIAVVCAFIWLKVL